MSGEKKGKTKVRPHRRKNRKKDGTHKVSGHTRRVGHSKEKEDKDIENLPYSELDEWQQKQYDNIDMGHFEWSIYSKLSLNDWVESVQSVGDNAEPMHKLIGYEFVSGKNIYPDVRDRLDSDTRDECDNYYMYYWSEIIGLDVDEVRKRMEAE